MNVCACGSTARGQPVFLHACLSFKPLAALSGLSPRAHSPPQAAPLLWREAPPRPHLACLPTSLFWCRTPPGLTITLPLIVSVSVHILPHHIERAFGEQRPSRCLSGSLRFSAHSRASTDTGEGWLPAGVTPQRVYKGSVALQCLE